MSWPNTDPTQPAHSLTAVDSMELDEFLPQKLLLSSGDTSGEDGDIEFAMDVPGCSTATSQGP
ncbi:hypothetical protein DPV78_005843 [Talaromyces pinophilus]|nr:hypothetical protein DPV78_005843 [Talaromyces pinophilus]